ncbi:hypothetical protein SAMN05421805_103252 [Saccharopolyspora antimicrobica]|uniref:Helix-turn-helix n=1 Tax=Saccharopolyspora antimicrobica TaxID=455193 RepID=A0A1I4X6C9_9PSEU|nr:hypothetical protein [Saccharopolyspora antimicrobica]RKT84325.1 hypothetical protein ATL45_2636 [Saccharopolyspora antimicrobica]SFN21063.1 hypothetical protein SAMN05421805_103252 [Saccharopolyspora antimicrobica]
MANTKDSAITAAEIEAYKRKINPKTGKKYTQNEIAAIAGVSRQRISQIKLASGNYSKTPRERVLEHYPWKTGAKFQPASPNRRLRDHAEYMATGGAGMSDDKLARLLGFYRFLEEGDLVIEFDPGIPPAEGVSSTGGFAYRSRKPSDGNLMIRVNEHTELTPEGVDLWVIPDKKPQVRRVAE